MDEIRINQQKQEELQQNQQQENVYVHDDLKNVLKQQEEMAKNEMEQEKLNINEFEDLLNQSFDEFEIFEEDDKDSEILSQKKADENFLKDIEQDSEIQGESATKTKKRKKWNPHIDKKKVEKEFEDRMDEEGMAFFYGDAEMDLTEDDDIKLTDYVDMAPLRESVSRRVDHLLSGKRKNQALLDLCFQMHALTEIDAAKYRDAGFEKGGIAGDYLARYGDKRFLSFLEREKLIRVMNLGELYRKNLYAPVPERYLAKKSDDPRDPELIRQYAAYLVKQSPEYRELKCINQIVGAFGKNKSDELRARIGTDDPGEYLAKQRESMTEDLDESDRSFLAESEALLVKLENEQSPRIRESIRRRDRADQLLALKKGFLEYFDDEKAVKALDLPRDMIANKVEERKLEKDEVYPRPNEGEVFHSSPQYRRVELTYRMAKLLSIGSLVGEAHKAQKNIKGVKTEGVLMKRYQGDTINKAHKENGKQLSTAARKQIAEITVLNLICGINLDMAKDVIVEKTAEGNDQLIDAVRVVSGMDKAFASISGSAIEDLTSEAAFTMQFLGNQPGEVKERILNLSPMMVEAVFQDDLSKTALEALLSRIDAVKKLIRTFDKKKKSTENFAEKKVRKYLKQVRNNSQQTRLENLGLEYRELQFMVDRYKDSFQNQVKDTIKSLQTSTKAEFFPQEKTRVEKAMKGQEQLFRSVLMEQVDRYLALLRSQDFAEKIRANDPTALAVKREYEQSLQNGVKRYRAKMESIVRTLNGVQTKEDLMSFAFAHEVINDREAFFADVQKSRYKNNEDSDSMYLVKESVRLLTERATDPEIIGPEALGKKLKELDEQYNFAIEDCRMYIQSHKPLIGFWHEDGRKRYEMVQELEKRLRREKERINANGKTILSLMMTNEKQTTNLSELLAFEELQTVKLSYLRMKEDAKAEDETGPFGQLAKNREACEKETLIDQKAVKDAVSKIREIEKPEFFARLHLASPEDVLRNKDRNDAVFSEMEKAYGVFRDYMLVNGDLHPKDCGNCDDEEKAAMRIRYRVLQDVKGAAEEYYRTAKDLALHPLRFTSEASSLDNLSLEELTAKEKEKAQGERKSYLKLLIDRRKSEKLLSGLATVGGITDYFEKTKEKIKTENAEKKDDAAVGLLKDLLKDAPDPVQEKKRVIYHLKDVFKENKTKVQGEPPKYLVAHLWGKSNAEIRAFVTRLYAGEPAERVKALQEIVEQGAKEATVLLHNMNKYPGRMTVNGEYYYGLALRSAALSDAYQALQDLQKEQKEKNPGLSLPELSDETREDVLIRIEIAKELGLEKYEERFENYKLRLQQAGGERGLYSYLVHVNEEEKFRKEMGLLPRTQFYHLLTLVRKKFPNTSPKAMLRLYNQMLMQIQRCGQTQFSGLDLKPAEELTEEQLEEELRKYEERRGIAESLPAAVDTYYEKYKVARKSPEYRKEEFQTKWKAFQELNIEDLKMKSIPEIIRNIKKNTALFEQAAEMKQLLSLALINGEKFTDEELMEAEIKCKVFHKADQLVRRIFDIVRREDFLYLDTDKYLAMEGKKIPLVKGDLNRNEENSFGAFFDDGLKEISVLGLRLGEGGIQDLEKAVRRQAMEHRKDKDKQIKDLYLVTHGKEITDEELQKRVKDYEKNRALWGAASLVQGDLFDRQTEYNRLIDMNNKKYGTNLNGDNPRELGAYIPNLPEEKQKELIKKWGEGDEGMLSIYSEMIEVLLNADYSLLEETSTEGMMKNFHKVSPLLPMIGESGDIFRGFQRHLTNVAKKMKQNGRSDDEINAFIREKMPSDEQLKKLFAIREVGMAVQGRWQTFRDKMVISQKYDMERCHGLLTIEDLDGMDQAAFTQKWTAGEIEDLDPAVEQILSNATNGFSAEVTEEEVGEETEFKVTKDIVKLSQNLRVNMEKAMKAAPLDEMKKIDYLS